MDLPADAQAEARQQVISEYTVMVQSSAIGETSNL